MMNKRLEMNEEMMAQVNGGEYLRADTGRLASGSGTEMFASGLAEAAGLALVDPVGYAFEYQSVLAAFE